MRRNLLYTAAIGAALFTSGAAMDYAFNYRNPDRSSLLRDFPRAIAGSVMALTDKLDVPSFTYSKPLLLQNAPAPLDTLTLPEFGSPIPEVVPDSVFKKYFAPNTEQAAPSRFSLQKRT